MSDISDMERLKAVLEPLLHCPVCYEVPAGSFFQCHEGHHVCSSCRRRLPACPLCRSFFYGTRNYGLEQIIETVRKLYCADKSSDGQSELFKKDMISELPKVKKVPAASPGLFRCHIKDCSVRLPLARLLQHIRYHHAAELVEGACDAHQSFIHTFDLSTKRKTCDRIAVQVSGIGLFFIYFNFGEKGAFRIWVAMCASETVARDFDYTLTVQGLATEAVFTDKMSSSMGNQYHLFRAGRCLQMSSWHQTLDLAAPRCCCFQLAPASPQRKPTPVLTLRPQLLARRSPKEDVPPEQRSPPTAL